MPATGTFVLLRREVEDDRASGGAASALRLEVGERGAITELAHSIERGLAQPFLP